jgi:hypothetical protein
MPSVLLNTGGARSSENDTVLAEVSDSSDAAATPS